MRDAPVERIPKHWMSERFLLAQSGAPEASNCANGSARPTFGRRQGVNRRSSSASRAALRNHFCANRFFCGDVSKWRKVLASSAGILMYRQTGPRLEVLLVHPGGPFWRNKDNGAWSIPKGEIAEDEDLLDAAKREFEEETGHKPTGKFIKLIPVKQKSGKVVHAWAVEGDLDPAGFKS